MSEATSAAAFSAMLAAALAVDAERQSALSVAISVVETEQLFVVVSAAIL